MAFAALALTAFAATPAYAARNKPVKVGVILPLSGPNATIGAEGKAAIELATKIINGRYPQLGNLLLAKGAGLSNLGGTKIKVIFADSEGSPVIGQSQALRLITQDHVAALQGAYASGVTLTTSAVAERYHVPFVNGDSTAPGLTKRGFKWFFRVTPIETNVSKQYISFLKHEKSNGLKVNPVAIAYIHNEYGSSVKKTLMRTMKASGFRMVSPVPYNGNAASMQPVISTLQSEKPNTVIFVSYTPDAILIAKTMKSMNYRPSIMIGDDSGYSDPSFVKSEASITEGLVDRSAWINGAKGSPTYILNEMYEKETGHGFDASSGRFMQAFFIMAEAINTAGSTNPVKVQSSLRRMDIKPDQLMMRYRGVKFDSDGNNVLADTNLTQMQSGHYVQIWPRKNGSAKVELPYKGWTK
ncbi:MAG: ABC transporter substrate-binding protein [Rhodanobacteraceae bacterium]